MRSILIVARPAPWREALGARLEQEGCAVTVVNDAHDALAVLVPPLPGAVFIDCDLPRKATRRLLAKLENGPGMSVRRLFVARALDAAAGPQSGPVFGKPVDPGHVARALRALYPDPEPGSGGPDPDSAGTRRRDRRGPARTGASGASPRAAGRVSGARARRRGCRFVSRG